MWTYDGVSVYATNTNELFAKYLLYTNWRTWLLENEQYVAIHTSFFEANGTRVTLEMMSGVYIVLAAGLLVSFVALGVEIMWHKRKQKKLRQWVHVQCNVARYDFPYSSLPTVIQSRFGDGLFHTSPGGINCCNNSPIFTVSFIYLSVYLPTYHLPTYLSISLLYICIRPSVRMSVRLSVFCLSIYLPL